MGRRCRGEHCSLVNQTAQRISFLTVRYLSLYTNIFLSMYEANLSGFVFSYLWCSRRLWLWQWWLWWWWWNSQRHEWNPQSLQTLGLWWQPQPWWRPPHMAQPIPNASSNPKIILCTPRLYMGKYCPKPLYAIDYQMTTRASGAIYIPWCSSIS